MWTKCVFNTLGRKKTKNLVSEITSSFFYLPPILIFNRKILTSANHFGCRVICNIVRMSKTPKQQDGFLLIKLRVGIWLSWVRSGSYIHIDFFSLLVDFYFFLFIFFTFGTTLMWCHLLGVHIKVKRFPDIFLGDIWKQLYGLLILFPDL